MSKRVQMMHAYGVLLLLGGSCAEGVPRPTEAQAGSVGAKGANAATAAGLLTPAPAAPNANAFPPVSQSTGGMMPTPAAPSTPALETPETSPMEGVMPGASGTPGVPGVMVASPGAMPMADSTAAPPMEMANPMGGVSEPRPLADVPYPTALKVTLTTVATARGSSRGARYSPRNCGSIWVEDGAGSFVKTLEVWSRNRCERGYMTAAYSHTDNNRVDAVTRGSLHAHETHTISWDLTDVAGRTVADGDYVLCAMVTEGQRADAPTVQIPFSLGAAGQTWVAPDGDHFKDIELIYE